MDGATGTVMISNYGTSLNALSTPYSYLSDLNFHSSLSYLQIIGKATTDFITVPGIVRTTIYWDDASSGCGGCCFIMLEARYGTGTMDSVVRRYRDEHLTEKNSRGYYKLAEVLVPLMRRSKVFKWVITKTLADPLVSYGKWHYKENKYGWIFKPVKDFWFNIFDILGSDTEFIRENGKVV